MNEKQHRLFADCKQLFELIRASGTLFQERSLRELQPISVPRFWTSEGLPHAESYV